MTTIKIEQINIENEGFHLKVEAAINSIPVSLLIDTGASRSVFHLASIEKICPENELIHYRDDGCGLGGDGITSHAITLHSIKLGTIYLPDYQAVVMNLHHINQTYLKINLPPIDGILGSDLLKLFNAQINYGNLTLTLHQPK